MTATDQRTRDRNSNSQQPSIAVHNPPAALLKFECDHQLSETHKVAINAMGIPKKVRRASELAGPYSDQNGQPKRSLAGLRPSIEATIEKSHGREAFVRTEQKLHELLDDSQGWIIDRVTECGDLMGLTLRIFLNVRIWSITKPCSISKQCPMKSHDGRGNMHPHHVHESTFLVCEKHHGFLVSFSCQKPPFLDFVHRHLERTILLMAIRLGLFLLRERTEHGFKGFTSQTMKVSQKSHCPSAREHLSPLIQCWYRDRPDQGFLNKFLGLADALRLVRTVTATRTANMNEWSWQDPNHRVIQIIIQLFSKRKFRAEVGASTTYG